MLSGGEPPGGEKGREKAKRAKRRRRKRPPAVGAKGPRKWSRKGAEKAKRREKRRKRRKKARKEAKRGEKRKGGKRKGTQNPPVPRGKGSRKGKSAAFSRRVEVPPPTAKITFRVAQEAKSENHFSQLRWAVFAFPYRLPRLWRAPPEKWSRNRFWTTFLAPKITVEKVIFAWRGGPRLPPQATSLFGGLFAEAPEARKETRRTVGKRRKDHFSHTWNAFSPYFREKAPLPSPWPGTLTRPPGREKQKEAKRRKSEKALRASNLFPAPRAGASGGKGEKARKGRTGKGEKAKGAKRRKVATRKVACSLSFDVKR